MLRLLLRQRAPTRLVEQGLHPASLMSVPVASLAKGEQERPQPLCWSLHIQTNRGSDTVACAEASCGYRCLSSLVGPQRSGRPPVCSGKSIAQRLGGRGFHQSAFGLHGASATPAGSFQHRQIIRCQSLPWSTRGSWSVVAVLHKWHQLPGRQCSRPNLQSLPLSVAVEAQYGSDHEIDGSTGLAVTHLISCIGTATLCMSADAPSTTAQPGRVEVPLEGAPSCWLEPGSWAPVASGAVHRSPDLPAALHNLTVQQLPWILGIPAYVSPKALEALMTAFS